MEKLKFSALSKSALDEREMKTLTGGYTCSCGCQGPSSTMDNGSANYDRRIQTKYPIKLTIVG